MPVHNEVDHLGEAVARVLAAPSPVPRELILVDDASRDGSGDLLRRIAAEHAAHEAGVRLLTRAEQGGKGCAVRDGIAVATGDWIVVQDADLEYDPADFVALLQPLIEDRADVVYGSRFRRERHQVHRTMHFLVNRTLTALSNIFSGIYLTDMETCYKARPQRPAEGDAAALEPLRDRDRGDRLHRQDRGADPGAADQLRPAHTIAARRSTGRTASPRSGTSCASTASRASSRRCPTCPSGSARTARARGRAGASRRPGRSR